MKKALDVKVKAVYIRDMLLFPSPFRGRSPMISGRTHPSRIACTVLAFLFAAAAPASGEVACDFAKAPCRVRVAEGTVTLDINPKPVKAMEELIFSVSVQELRTPQVMKLSLRMPGMHMGPNLVTLKRSADGTYSGKGVLPRCSSGRNHWSATLATVGGDVSFLFDVR